MSEWTVDSCFSMALHLGTEKNPLCLSAFRFLTFDFCLLLVGLYEHARDVPWHMATVVAGLLRRLSHGMDLLCDAMQ